MGLDMYLYRRSYVNNGDFYKDEYRQKITIENGPKATQVKSGNIKYVIDEVAYWRKANHIHKWFVDNVQNGEDDCGEYTVNVGQLKALCQLCKSVLDKSVPVESLPRMGGFFFGGTEYDDWYFRGCEDTVTMLTPLLTDEDNTFYYTSSW